MSPTLRLPAKRPGFFIAATLLIALGVASATAAFTIVHTLFFKPRAGIDRPAELYNVHPARPDGETGSWSYPDFIATRDGATKVAGLLAFTGLETGLAHGNRSFSVKTQLTSANFFALLGVRPAAGRLFLPADDQSIGGSPVAVISHRLWLSEFNGAPDVIGRSVRVNGEPLTIVGVAQPGFHGTFIGFDMDLWVPLAMARIIGAEADLSSRDAHWLEVIARVPAGTPVAAAQAELQQRYEAIGAHKPKPSGHENGSRLLFTPNRPIDHDLRGAALGFAGVLAGVAGLVLVIASLNVGGLLLTCAEERRRESAVRLALGAGRGHLLRQWLGESLMIFSAGGAIGLLFTVWISDLSLFRQPTQFLPLTFDFSPDLRTFAFCFLTVLVTGLLTGLVPALRAFRTDVVGDLKSGGHGATASARLRNILVAGQLALALVPIVIATLFARTLDHASRLSPGFDPDSLLSVTLNLGQLGDVRMHGPPAVRRLVDAARSVPGVASVTATSRMPMGPGGLSTHLKAPDAVVPLPEQGQAASLTFVDADYFSTLQIPLLAGRGFSAAEAMDARATVAVLGEALAQRLYGSPGAALGREIQRGNDRLRVIGVARQVRYSRLWEDPRAQFYLPLSTTSRARVTIAVRASGQPAALIQPLFDALRAAQPDLPMSPPLPGRAQIDFTLLPQKIGSRVALVLGGVCLVLAATGLYGVLALGAVRQQREFGVRLALGAQKADLVGLVARRVAWLAGSGAVLGGTLAYALARLLRSFFHGISPLDPLAYAATVLVLVLVAFLASWLPARRAARVDPLVALRAE